MGKIYVTDLDNPRSAMALVGSFAFYAGEPDKELVLHDIKRNVIMIPQNKSWESLIESSLPATKMIRYGIKKTPRFNQEKLKAMAKTLPEGYEIRKIDSEIYDLCLATPSFEDFVSSFDSKEMYLTLGRGFVVMRDGRIVSGASSYSRYREGIEIEVNTLKEERHKGLAGAVCAALILSCLDEGLYPRWDAANLMSVRLAEKLGYEFSHEYIWLLFC